jgi:hypothetical protein
MFENDIKFPLDEDGHFHVYAPDGKAYVLEMIDGETAVIPTDQYGYYSIGQRVAGGAGCSLTFEGWKIVKVYGE